eukprot:3615942-Amphidinium_carterae.1
MAYGAAAAVDIAAIQPPTALSRITMIAPACFCKRPAHVDRTKSLQPNSAVSILDRKSKSGKTFCNTRKRTLPKCSKVTDAIS